MSKAEAPSTLAWTRAAVVVGGVALVVTAAAAGYYVLHRRHRRRFFSEGGPTHAQSVVVDIGTMDPVLDADHHHHHLTSPTSAPATVDLSHVRWEDMLLGLAIGDSFGAGVEFKSREWIQAHVDFTRYVNAREGAWAEGFADGKYTDDTEMTLGLMKALIETGDLRSVDEDVLLAYWFNEYETGIKLNGFGRQGHGSILKFYTGEKTIEEVRGFQVGRDYPGNAPPMRALPLGFLPEADMERISLANADSTHPHPKARAASLLVARAVRHLLVEGHPHENIISACAAGIERLDQETSEYLARVDQLPDYHLDEVQRDFLPVQEVLCGPQPLTSPFTGAQFYGLNSDSMRTAGCVLYLLKWHRDTFESLKESIRMGGDVDSLAAIVVGILGGKYGLGELPEWLFEPLEDKAYLHETARRFQHFAERLTAGGDSS